MEQTILQQQLKQIYNEFVSGLSIDAISKRHGVTCTEAYNLVQMGKRLCQ